MFIATILTRAQTGAADKTLLLHRGLQWLVPPASVEVAPSLEEPPLLRNLPNAVQEGPLRHSAAVQGTLRTYPKQIPRACSSAPLPMTSVLQHKDQHLELQPGVGLLHAVVPRLSQGLRAPWCVKGYVPCNCRIRFTSRDVPFFFNVNFSRG